MKKQNLIDFYNFQELCVERAGQYLVALGRDHYNGYKWSGFSRENFDICETNGKYSIDVLFRESTRHDSPDYATVTLSEEQVLMKNVEWVSFIDTTTKETAHKTQKAKQEKEQRILDEKKRQLERLKEELGDK